MTEFPTLEEWKDSAPPIPFEEVLIDSYAQVWSELDNSDLTLVLNYYLRKNPVFYNKVKDRLANKFSRIIIEPEPCLTKTQSGKVIKLFAYIKNAILNKGEKK